MTITFNEVATVVGVVGSIVTIVMAFYSTKEHQHMSIFLSSLCIVLVILTCFFVSDKELNADIVSNKASAPDEVSKVNVVIPRFAEIISESLPIKTHPTEFASNIYILKRGDLALYKDLSRIDFEGLNWHYVCFEQIEGWICSSGCILH